MTKFQNCPHDRCQSPTVCGEVGTCKAAEPDATRFNRRTLHADQALVKTVCLNGESCSFPGECTSSCKRYSK